VRIIGRYALYDEIAAGGMATVHLGRLLGPAGFARTVAIKRLHPQFAKDPEFVSMFLDEARLAARIRHPNVVSTLDVVAESGELFLVMDYVQGEALSKLIRAARERQERIPPRIVSGVLSGALQGLHAAHEAKNERGEPLGIVHRDISPQNVMVGADGVARVLDFGVAKAAGRIQTTREGQIKGKLAYMAPEQLQGHVTRRTDIYAAGVVLWEALVGKRLFSGDNEGAILTKILQGSIEPPSAIVPELGPAVDEVILRALDRDPEQRFATAREMAVAVERAIPPASSTEIGEWVEHVAHTTLATRAERLAEIESSSDVGTIGQLLATSVGAASPPTPSSSASSVHQLAEPPVSQASQLSSVSLSREYAGLPSRRVVPVWALGIVAGALALVGLVGVLGAVKLGGRKDDAPEHEPGAKALAAEPMIPVPSPTPEPSAPAVAPSAEPLPTPTALPPKTPTARPTTQPTSAPRPTLTARPTATATASAKPPATAAKSCDPPYTLDAQGHKKWKPECL
jgi:serine/threonine-protein kinase